MIVFLDFDGVLHPDPCHNPQQLFENAPRLAHTLDPFPAVALVLSTAWRQSRPFDQLIERLPPLLRQRTIGITPTFGDFTTSPDLVPYRRQAECMQWLKQNRLDDEPWLALDDRSSGFIPYCENLIACHPRSGFDAAASAHLRSALERHLLRQGQAVDLQIG